MITRWLERIGERNLGLLGIVGTVLLGAMVGLISFVPIGEKHYSAELTHTAGLREGEEVQVAGVGAGKVRDITLQGRHVLVDFTLDGDVHLGRSTRASVKIATLLGNHFLEVEPAGGGDLADDRIGLAHTSVPFNLQDVIDGSSGALNDLDGKAVAKQLTVIGDALDYSPAQSRAAIDGISRLSRQAAEQSDRVNALVASTKDVTALLASNSGELVDLMKKGDVITQELTKRREVIHRMLRDAQRLAKAVTGILDDNDKDFAPLMRNLTIALRHLRQQEKNISDGIDGLATVAHYVTNASGSGNYIDIHVPVGLPDNVTCQGSCP